ncbi:hypothetical protein KR51_00015870 [Rubidibacter lacunae KORDI 51-2]|uniref:Uncharacterized protein n=1 Tax=Rubidibacter lacunae KORDI 51-2 TaxID=582515 RepID=U5DPW0_9CHRO|nr:hypothetical protein KR51_00015870 [Rubidibacter lacunae KORDI 51-2]
MNPAALKTVGGIHLEFGLIFWHAVDLTRSAWLMGEQNRKTSSIDGLSLDLAGNANYPTLN